MLGGSRVDAPMLLLLATILALVPVGLVLRVTIEPSTGERGPSGLPAETPTPEPEGPLAPPWELISGTWTREGELIVHDDESLESAAIATVFIGQDPTVAVDVLDPRRGAGIVVRYLDAENHWIVFADPAASLWRVVKVVDGISTGVEAISADIGSDTRVAVASVPGELTIAIDGVEHSIIDAELDDAGRVGLVALDASGGPARWSNFRAGAGVGFAGVAPDGI